MDERVNGRTPFDSRSASSDSSRSSPPSGNLRKTFLPRLQSGVSVVSPLRLMGRTHNT